MSKEKNTNNQESMETGNVDQIRDIIFGAQMRDYEKRFIRLEERLLSESNSLRGETNSRLDTLENYIKQEVSSLSDSISVERGEREDDTRHLSNELNKQSQEQDKKLSQLQQSSTQAQADLRDALLEQSKSLLTEIQNARNTLSASLDKSTEELRDDKADRRALADMFSEFAMRLNGDFKLPEGKE
ncbi:MAG: hypothetical protein Q9M11_03080 [Mariprofundaceae bacterium]|nr:hypothetical protein [Mariprofundaceae bacterium]